MYQNNLPPTANMVNYTNVLTPASNEIYVSNTVPEDSLAFLMKNNIIINFSFEDATLPSPDKDQLDKTTSVY